MVITYKEFRKDGWPLCPNCEEDELYCPSSVQIFLDKGWIAPTIQECIESGLQCYYCNQTIKGVEWQVAEVIELNRPV